MRRVSFYTLGCKLNFADTGSIRRQFVENGFSEVPFGISADVTVINTCSVTEEADRKCRQVVRRALRTNPDSFVLVTGCYAQLQPARLAAIPGVDAVLGTQEKFSVFDIIPTFSKSGTPRLAVSCIDDRSKFESSWSGAERTRAFLKVQDGCDYSCSFCTIPIARGPARSDTIASVVGRAAELRSEGFREVVISGVNVGLFRDGNGTLIDLLRAIDASVGSDDEARSTDIRFRISSIEPNLLTDEIIEFVAGSPSFVAHFHVPLQSGNNNVLGRMRRRYSRELYAARIGRIKQTIPDACIGSDVIAGFSGESKEEFEGTRSFLRDLPISYLHVFTYSERPYSPVGNTGSADKVGSVPKDERSRRTRQLRQLSEQKLSRFYVEQQGRSARVLWEDRLSGDAMSGFTDNYVRVRKTLDCDSVGHFERVVLGPQVGNSLSVQT